MADGAFVHQSGNASVDVRLLGGVDVMVDDVRVPIGGGKPRALLALLALQPEVVVSVDRLVDEVWEDAAPPTVRSSIQVHVSNLRRALSGAGAEPLFETRGDGYVFVADALVVDVHRFEHRTRAARQAYEGGNLEAALVSVHEARTLWRGTPLAGVASAPFVAARITTLEHEFLALIELYADVEIALGRPADAIGELERVVADHPYRETTWARLALALYRSGRQVDALARIKAVRRILAEDLGLDPSPEIAALELAILNQDPALSGGLRSPSAPAASFGERLPTESRLPAIRSLMGRDELVRSIAEIIDDERLVTIVGPGGVGKTSVAVTAAARVAGSRPTSARFVDLAVVDGVDGLLPSVMASVGARSEDLTGALSDVVSTLNAHTDPLLVLDNCEHLIDEVAPLVVELLARCPSLHVLATSRTALSIPDEVVIACGPLPTQTAIDLFVSRAQMLDRDYVATESEREAITVMVERLDGLPLAIELFAGRVATMSAVEMVARFDGDELLTASWRSTSTARHRSLHDVVGWSYALLGDDEQRCLRRLSVFGGSVSADAVQAVCSPASLTTLDGLVMRSLVIAERTATGVRYRLLATVRAFAVAELQRDPDRAGVRQRMLDWTIAWACGLAKDFASPDPSTAMDEIEANAPNVRAAHDIAHELGPGRSARLLAAFGPFGLSLTLALPEALAWAQAVLPDTSGAVALEDRLVLLILTARLTNVGTDERTAQLQEAIALAEQLGDARLSAAAWAVYATVAMNDATPALAAAQRAIELAGPLNEPLTVAWGLHTAATELVRLRRFDEARLLLDRHCVAGTNRFGAFEGHVLFQRGRLAMLRGDLETARREFCAGEHATTRTRSFAGLSASWYGLAEVARLSGDIEAASAGYRRCLPIDLVLEPSESGLIRMMIVWTACLLGDIDVAEHHTAVLVEDRALERVVTKGETFLAAVAAAAEGLLALCKGMNGVADVTLREAIGLWATSDCWDVVADLIDRLAELHDETTAAELRELAAGVRDGSVSLRKAVDRVQHVPPAGHNSRK